MNPLGNHIKKHSKPYWCVFLSSLSVALFSFLFVFAQSADFPDQFTDFFEHAEYTAPSSSDHSIIVNHDQPGHIPFHAIFIAPEREFKNEKEKDSHSDEDTGQLIPNVSLAEPFHVASGKCLLLQLLQLHENRKEVSLFILHHSWKSYLA